MSWIAVVIFLVIVIPMLGLLAVIGLRESSVRVGQRQIGVVIVRGKPSDRVLSAGAHFLAPFGQDVEIYPDHELTYMALPGADGDRDGGGDVDYADPPFGTSDGEGTFADLSYTVRVRMMRSQLRQIHERFGPTGIKGIIRDRSRQTISDFFAEDGRRFQDLLGTARPLLEQALAARVRENLAPDGFEVVFFSLQEPDLRGLGDVLHEQVRTRGEVELEAIRAQVEQAAGRRLEGRARVDAHLTAERTTALAEAEAEALRLRAAAEATVEEEWAIRRVLTAAKARELEVAKLREHLAAEEDLQVRQAEIAARSAKVLSDGLSPLAVRYRAVEAWRDVMERWDGRALPAAPFTDQRPESVPASPPGDDVGTAQSELRRLPPT